MKRRQGNITKRGRNSWQIKFDVQPNADGKRQQRYATARGSYQDAQKELRRLLNAADAGTLPDPSSATVGEYLRSWLDSAHEQSPKTLERYRELAERQIVPHLGAIKLQKFKPETLRQWHGALLGTGLSARTVGHAHRLLRLVLAYAVKSGTLDRNVAAIERPPAVEDREIEIISPEQIATVALGTGMRRGELCGLQWGDIDLNKATLRVERSVEETKAGLRLKSPKTRRGRRSLTLPPETVTTLRAHRARQLERRLILGMGNIKPSTVVVSNVEGGLISPHSVSRAWRRFLIDHKLPRVPFHALRHTHVSLLIAAKVDILTISRRLGHSKASVTLDVYGHLMSGADAAAAEAISGVLK
jgi:integrase